MNNTDTLKVELKRRSVFKDLFIYLFISIYIYFFYLLTYIKIQCLRSDEKLSVTPEIFFLITKLKKIKTLNKMGNAINEGVKQKEERWLSRLQFLPLWLCVCVLETHTHTILLLLLLIITYSAAAAPVMNAAVIKLVWTEKLKESEGHAD